MTEIENISRDRPWNYVRVGKARRSTNGAIAAAVSLEEMERKEKAEEYKKRQLEEEKEARRAKKFRPDDD